MNITTNISLLTLLAMSSISQAALIIPDSASASTEFVGFEAIHTINGSGLPVGYDETSVHGSYTTQNHWTTLSGDVVGAHIDWGFIDPQDLATIFIWTSRRAGYEPTSFNLTLFDSLDDELLSLSNVALQPDTEFAQEFYFGSLVEGVSRVRFEVLATQDPTTNFTGLAEVAFSQIPEPSLPLLAAFGIALLGVRRRS